MKNALTRLLIIAAAVILGPGAIFSAHSKELKIAMITWRGETKAEQGFKEGLKELGYSVQYTAMDAGQNKTKLGHILREELQPRLKDFDYVYTFGTTVTKAAKQIINNQVPQVFTIVVDPVGAGIVKSMNAPGANISGASNQVSLAVQLDTALKVMKFRKLGLLFNPREKNSALVRQTLQQLAAKRHFEVVDLRSPPVLNSLKENLQNLRDRKIVVDAVYLPADSFILSQAKLVGAELKGAGIKSVASIKKYVDNGALMGLVPEYHELGKAAARIVDQNQKGAKLETIPVYTQPEPVLVVNKTTARALKTDIPQALLAKAIVVQ